MVVLLVGIYSEGSVWLVQEVQRVLRVLGVGSKMKFWMDCNTSDEPLQLQLHIYISLPRPAREYPHLVAPAQAI
jgi:hypothetical protein